MSATPHEWSADVVGMSAKSETERDVDKRVVERKDFGRVNRDIPRRSPGAPLLWCWVGMGIPDDFSSFAHKSAKRKRERRKVALGVCAPHCTRAGQLWGLDGVTRVVVP